MKLKRKQLRKNSRALHPIRNRAQEERNHELMLEYQRRLFERYTGPRWFRYVMVVAMIGAVVAGYLCGHPSPQPQQYDSHQTRL